MVRILVFFVLAGAGIAQSTSPEDSSQTATVVVHVAAKDAAVSVAPGDTVLMVHDICSPSQTTSPGSTEDCTLMLNRQQFEDLLKIVAPGQGAPGAKQRLAQTYTELVAFESVARRAGIDRSPQFLETMEWLRLRTLADLYRRSLEREASTITEEEINEYYREHTSQFEQVKLRRILLPRNNFAVADKQEFEKKALQIAADIRERAAKGEDLDRLQRETYQALGLDGVPPASDVGNRRRNGLTPEVSDDVFALRPGEISKVEQEAYSFVIYKVEQKWTQPKQQVKEEIAREISKQRLEAALKAVTGSVHAELNEEYFGRTPQR